MGGEARRTGPDKALDTTTMDEDAERFGWACSLNPKPIRTKSPTGGMIDIIDDIERAKKRLMAQKGIQKIGPM